MTHRFLRLFLLGAIVFSSIGLTGCSLSFFKSPDSPATTALGDAAFRVVDLVLNQDDIFVIAPDTVLLVKDAITLVKTMNANQSPPKDAKSGHIRVSILYNKRGVDSQDVYDINTGKAKLGVLLEGGTTFESFSGSNVNIDATHTHKITIVPLQNAASNVNVSAGKGWQNTGIFLKRGKQFKVRYVSGTWTIAKSTVGMSDAAGQPINAPANLICRCGEPLEGYSTQGLIGRIGAGVGYVPMQVGDDFSGIAYDNDFLYLRMNLPDQLLPNSAGTLATSIETSNN